MRQILALLSCLLAFLVATPVTAITIESNDGLLSINGYFNTGHTSMGQMPMIMMMDMGAMGMLPSFQTMPNVNTYESDANLLFSMRSNETFVRLNLSFRNATSGGAQGSSMPAMGMDMNNQGSPGGVLIDEAYGEYAFSDRFQFRGGFFPSHFGLYNHVRFATPLFAPVVLPMFYQPPMNYAGAPLLPSASNLMAFGEVLLEYVNLSYSIFLGNGAVALSGNDLDRKKSIGARASVGFGDDLTFGTSLFTDRTEGDAMGRRELIGVDIEYFLSATQFEAEYVQDRMDVGENRISYYGRISHQAGKLNPFFGYDYLEDKNILLYAGGHERYSAGTAYTLHLQVTLKAEYHYHRFKNTSGFGNAPGAFSMVRTAAIFNF